MNEDLVLKNEVLMIKIIKFDSNQNLINLWKQCLYLFSVAF